MTECYECARLAELMAENSALRDRCGNYNDENIANIRKRIADEQDSREKLEADDMPEGDAVAILRKAAKCTSVNTSVGDVLRYNVPGNGCSAWQTAEDACEALADMVERDYVSKDTIDGWLKAFQLEHGDGEISLLDPATLNDLWTAIADDIPLGYEASKRLADWLRIAEIILERDYVSREAYEDLRDEFVWISTFLHRVGKQCGTKDVPSLKAYVEQLEAKVDELTEQLESAHAKNRSLKAHIAKMQEGRHGWHVKYPELEKKNAELQAKADRLARENVALARDLGECMAERDELRSRSESDSGDAIRDARMSKLLSQRDELQAAYDAMVGKCAELCALAGFSMVDASGEVVS